MELTKEPAQSERRVEIKGRWSGAVLYACNIPQDVPSCMEMRHALEKATEAGANLAGAYLAGAYLDGARLLGSRPIYQIGPIGSRCAYLQTFITDQGIKVRAGCFFGSLEEFSGKVDETHADNEHGREYRTAIDLIKAHAEIWTPKESA